MGRRAAFTLIETILVMTVLLLLAAVAVPRMGSTLGQARLKQAARDVVGLLRYARDLAVFTQTPCEVRFDVDGGRYELVAVDEQGREIRTVDARRRTPRQRLALADDVGGERRLPAKVRFEIIHSEAAAADRGRTARVVYAPDGSATPAQIALVDDRGQWMRVQVYRTTGMARVELGRGPRQPEGGGA